MPDDISNRMATYALLGQLWREEQDRPADPSLRLTEDGWEVHGGEYDHLPLHCDKAYAIAEMNTPPFGDEVIRLTRNLCGDLRITIKARGTSRQKAAEQQQTLDDLRAGLARIREAKAA